MLRAALGLAVGLSLGIIVGWLVFDSPFGGKDPQHAGLEHAVIRAYGVHALSAHCTQREYPTTVFDCTVQPDDSSDVVQTRATVGRHGQVTLSPFHTAADGWQTPGAGWGS